MAIPNKNVLGNPNVTEGDFQVAIESLRESVIGSGKPYDSANTYQINDSCVYNNIVYFSKIDGNIGNTPSLGEYWELSKEEDTLGTPIASAATITIGTAGMGDTIHITGAVPINSLGTAAQAGVRRLLIFDSATTLTHSSSLICPNATSISTVAGMTVEVIAESTSVWRVTNVMRPIATVDNCIMRANGTGGAVQASTAYIDDNGNLLVTGNGLGYGVGAGGTVTQLTSKLTAVTLNKPTGRITMNNASLASGATVVFQVNNSLVTANDTVLVIPLDNANYDVTTGWNTNGAFVIKVKNITAGALAESLQIQFSIIKGAIA